MNQYFLACALALEVTLFAFLSPTFFTTANLLELLRFSVELGLLAVALTPIFVIGGIDLSVGSTVGLVSVLFGLAATSDHLSISSSIFLALFIGIICGALNAILIAYLRLPALIVTLATYSLYRGLAEGATHGFKSFTGYPPSFLLMGQGYLHSIPIQLLIFLPVILLYDFLLRRSVIGRGLYAIGFNTPGARYAGIPVRRYQALLYVLCGLVSALAAIIYVAHLGLAKSDLGTGFELQAITAVVLGGTSVLGGRGTITGTLYGLLFLACLQNGMHLLGTPSEVTGVITGILLLSVVALDFANNKLQFTHGTSSFRRYLMRSALATLLIAMAMIGFVSIKRHSQSSHGDKRLLIAVMPKAKGDPYFVSARAGAEEAAEQLGVDLIWDGPTTLDASQQNELVENWITRGVDAIAVAVENKGSISTVLRKAREHHISVLTWDADAETGARDYFLNQATPEGIAEALVGEAARLLPNGGQFAIITGALSADNQNEWIASIKHEVATKHPNLQLLTVLPSDDDRDKAFTQTQSILKVYPQAQLVIAISAPAVPGAAEAVKQANSTINVIGLSLPSICRSYIHSGAVQSIVLWNTRDLGYLTVYAAWLDATHKIALRDTEVSAGKLGSLQIRGSQIILGKPLLIDKRNIDSLPF